MRYIFCLLFCLLTAPLAAQTAAEAKALYDKGDYGRAKPAYARLVKQQPANGNYHLFYGVCCLATGEADLAVKHLETAVKKRVPTGQLYLGQAYHAAYRFEDAVETLEAYIAELRKRKRDTTSAEIFLEQSKRGLRMLKGVERVCVVDSFVVAKATFLDAYKLSAESGRLSTFEDYFGGTHRQEEEGTVHETELGNLLYYGERQADGTVGIAKRIREQHGTWSEAAAALTDKTDGGRNANYPFVLPDGLTLYFAADGEGSMGGYDIFVTRRTSGGESWVQPENVGMPFNSPDNDYMYVVDEFNNLGWFASDRRQPADSVCIYVFVPNSEKRVYDYQETDGRQLVSLAKLLSVSATWTDSATAEAARERLQAAVEAKPQDRQQHDFLFVVDDNRTYDRIEAFRSPQARALFGEYRQMEQELQQKREELNHLRDLYTQADPTDGKPSLTPTILSLELQLRRIEKDLAETAVEVRRLEINY